jgi:tetraprenyl-beta-curcumene synthase
MERAASVLDVDQAERRVAAVIRGGRQRRAPSERVGVGWAFAFTAVRYAAGVYPAAASEISRWRRRAERIPDAVLRRQALAALCKRGNMEGAALFAAFARRAERAEAVRAIVAFQSAYNYLDLLAEQGCDDPVANARQLHGALLVALDPGGAAGRASHPDYYAHRSERDDGGFLVEMAEACRTSLAALPSYALVAPSARAAAARIVAFQSLNLGESQGSHEELERWARGHTPHASGLAWWEAAAAGGSSLVVHMLIGRAAQVVLDPRELPAIERLYCPWIGALHSLLDSAIDVAEDRREGQRNLLGYYPSQAHAAARLGRLAERARDEASRLARDERHPTAWQEQVVLIALAAYYLSSPTASALDAQLIARSVADAIGPPMKPALVLFRAARAVSRCLYGRADSD